LEIWQLLEKKAAGKVETIAPDASLRDLAKKLIALRMGALIVTDKDEQLVGIIQTPFAICRS